MYFLRIYEEALMCEPAAADGMSFSSHPLRRRAPTSASQHEYSGSGTEDITND